MKHALMIIPARAGSVGVSKKNTRAIAGVPMMAWAIEKLGTLVEACAKTLDLHVHCVFASDDPEVLARVMAHQRYQHVTSGNQWLIGLLRPPEQAGPDQTIADLVDWVVTELGPERAAPDVIEFIGVHQPSSPTFSAQSMYNMIAQFLDHPEHDSATTVVSDSGFRWNALTGQDPARRVNRQFRTEDELRWAETGALHLVRSFPQEGTASSMIGQTHDLFEIDAEQAIDIDTPLDFAAAQTVLDRPVINILAHGDSTIGSGHLRRAGALARGLQPYAEVRLFAWKTPLEMRRIFDGDVPNVAEKDLGLVWVDADLVVVDCLNLDVRQHTARHPNRTIRLESTLIDSNTELINGLYTFPFGTCGAPWVDIRDEFRYLPPYLVNNTIESIMVSFGGTDPANLTGRVCELLLGMDFLDGVQITAVSPPHGVLHDVDPDKVEIVEAPMMAWEMTSNDLLITGRGRTQYEAAAVGVPTISIPVNLRERYEHGVPDGVVTIEPEHVPGEDYDPWPTVEEVLDREVYMACDVLGRRERSQMMQRDVDGHGMDRIVERVLVSAREARRSKPPRTAALEESDGV